MVRAAAGVQDALPGDPRGREVGGVIQEHEDGGLVSMTGVYRSYALAIYLELAGIVGLNCRIAVIVHN